MNVRGCLDGSFIYDFPATQSKAEFLKVIEENGCKKQLSEIIPDHPGLIEKLVDFITSVDAPQRTEVFSHVLSIAGIHQLAVADIKKDDLPYFLDDLLSDLKKWPHEKVLDALKKAKPLFTSNSYSLGTMSHLISVTMLSHVLEYDPQGRGADFSLESLLEVKRVAEEILGNSKILYHWDFESLYLIYCVTGLLMLFPKELDSVVHWYSKIKEMIPLEERGKFIVSLRFEVPEEKRMEHLTRVLKLN
jgi:hypothetical protein